MKAASTKWIFVGLSWLWFAIPPTANAQLESSWSQTAYAKASNTQAGDGFGRAVAVSGDTIAIGAPEEDGGSRGVNGNEDNLSSPDSGAVYVYVFENNRWTQQAYIKSSNSDPDDRFGAALALSGDVLVVGAPREDSNSTGIDGEETDNSSSNSGAVYVFERSNGRWRQTAYVKASNTGDRDRFGTSVDVFLDTFVVGAPEEDSNATGTDGDGSNNSSIGSGAAYVFTRNGSRWVQENYLKPPNTGAGDNFGWSVSINRRTLAVGAPQESGSDTGVGSIDNNLEQQSGAAYIFDRERFDWTFDAYIKAFNTERGDLFGWSVSLSVDELLVGAIGEDSNATGVNGDMSNNLVTDSGAAYTYVRVGRQWFKRDYLKATNTQANDGFGESVAIQRDRLVVATGNEDSSATGIDGDQTSNGATDSGAAYTFDLEAEDWTVGNYIKASNTNRNDFFGVSVALSDGAIIVGADGEESRATGINGDEADNSRNQAGAAYVYANPTDRPPTINAGLSDAWYNRNTLGQGVIVTVYPGLHNVFASNFTFDTLRPPAEVEAIFGEPGHRWLTGFGPFAGSVATLEVELTSGGVFNAPSPTPNQETDYGTWTLRFNDCNSLTLVYDFPELNISGVMDLIRLADDNVDLCLELGFP